MSVQKTPVQSITERPDKPVIQTGNFNKRSNSMLKSTVKRHHEMIQANKKSSNVKKGSN